MKVMDPDLCTLAARLVQQQKDCATELAAARLSRQQSEVLRLICKGQDYIAIARELNSTVEGVRTSMKMTLKKLGCTRAEAIVLATRAGLA